MDVHVQVCAQADLVVLPSALRRERGRAPTPGGGGGGGGAAAWEGRPVFHGFTNPWISGCTWGVWFRMEDRDALELACKHPAL